MERARRIASETGAPVASRCGGEGGRIPRPLCQSFAAAERGYVGDVIEPHETRPRVIRALRMLENKVDSMPRKKHGNIPL